jgi:uncharacterized protein
LTRIRRVALIQVAILVALFGALIFIFGSILAESAVHVAPARVFRQSGSLAGEEVQIQGPDGAALHARLFRSSQPDSDYVIVLHGTDPLIRMLVKNHYSVLAPGNRTLMTYGVREAPDVHLWADFLFHTQPVKNLFGLGESTGADILLQSLPLEPRFQAVVAESPFSTFTAMARERVYQNFGSDAFWIRSIAVPVVFSGLLYARMHYGVDLAAASPLDAVRRTSVPILLIHGLRDTDILPEHSRILLLANPRHIVPWFVPKAGHAGAYSSDPAQFEERVVSFFRSYEH